MKKYFRKWFCILFCINLWFQRGAKAACTMAQFPCRNQQCISLDKYCDGKRDCADGSDEPTGCSPCNRTYYGRVGATYKIKIPRPKKSSLPHFCQLTFMASGDVYGDLVQINIEKFNLGRFLSHTMAGCPDGYMQIEELSRSTNTGYWCGSSWGHNVYYSETSSVSVMLRVFNLTGVPQQSGSKSMVNDDLLLQITYRFLIQEKAVLRYGVPYSPSYLGVDVSGTFCNRYLENCDKRNCKLQSPNYPGIYPRNLTCSYHIKQKFIPDGKVALIRVSQRNPHMIYIKDQNAPHLSKETKFIQNSECHILHDYLVIYDGNSTQDPVLFKACKGGSITAITTSGPDMLLVFHVSPFDFPFQDSPLRRIFGFQLDVEVLMVGRESTAYIKNNNAIQQSDFYPTESSAEVYSCKWEITSRGQRSGYVQAPSHSILSNTTCFWRLMAGSNEVVWLYFLHYRHVMHQEIPQPKHCPTTLMIYDGDSTTANSTLIGQFCKQDRYPRVCSGVHAPGTVGATAPCPPSESYVSKSSALTLKLNYEVGTLPAHIEFLARYEFVDLRQWGQPLGSNRCNRLFKADMQNSFESPKNIFFYGRGGSRSLRCIYKFLAQPNERIHIRIIRSKIGSICKTRFSHSSQRYECSHGGVENNPSIKLVEKLWSSVHLTRACLCNVSELSSFSLKSYTNEIDLVFDIPTMSPAEDFNDYFFQGEYKVRSAKHENNCKNENHEYNGKFGNFTVGQTKDDACNTLPHIINAEDGSFLYVKIEGHSLEGRDCHTDSRINIYAVGKAMPLASACPSNKGESAYVFSNGWEWSFNQHSLNYLGGNFISYPGRNYSDVSFNTMYPPRSRTVFRVGKGASRDLIIEYSGNNTGKYLVTWVGVWKPIQMAALSSPRADICPHKCPAVEACLPPELWCDGIYHCPSLIDEGASACGILAALPWVSLAVGLALLISLLVLLAAVMRHRQKVLEQKTVEISTVQNSENGVKSTTQELLLPLEKEPTW